MMQQGVQEATQLLFSNLITLIDSADTPLTFKLLIVDALSSLKYKTMDAEFLISTNLLRVLHQIMNSASHIDQKLSPEQVQLSSASFTLFSLITVSLWNDVNPATKSESATSSLSTIQKLIVDTLLHELDLAISAYGKFSDIGTEEKASIIASTDNSFMQQYATKNTDRLVVERCGICVHC
jgi:hypothetical protein